jgi:hypothetical protein
MVFLADALNILGLQAGLGGKDGRKQRKLIVRKPT